VSRGLLGDKATRKERGEEVRKQKWLLVAGLECRMATIRISFLVSFPF
jgi:hypothetical protein